MDTQKPPPLAKILTEEGKKIIAKAIREGSILSTELPRAIKPEACVNGALKVSVASIMVFLKDRRIKLLAPYPAPQVSTLKPPSWVVAVKEPEADEDVDELEKPRRRQKIDVAIEPPKKREGAYDGDTALKLYMQEVGRHKLLTPKEEVELASRIKKGDMAAREEMIVKNLRLVVTIAHHYEGLGLPLLDLINEGNLGLMKAVERFDPALANGGKFSTYGSLWIKQTIRRALADKGKIIRVPVHMVEKISKIRITAMRLQEIFKREPTDEEIGEELGITAARVAHLRSAAIRPASLDAPIGDDDSNKLAELIRDENARDAYEELEEKTEHAMLRKFVMRLNSRERKILEFRFGLNGGTEKTLEEVGLKFKVTRERIRQVQNKALAKIRAMVAEEETGIMPSWHSFIHLYVR